MDEEAVSERDPLYTLPEVEDDTRTEVPWTWEDELVWGALVQLRPVLAGLR